MTKCHGPDLSKFISGNKKIVLAGNPNTGKSVFFNYLTGLYVDVSNYPGTTLEIAHGRMGDDVIIDTPGVYGISSFNDEEKVARDIILNADVVVNVVSAFYLERDLFLTQQIIDTGVPVIIALNMMDEAENHGIHIDIELLSELLGVPVVPTVAIKKKGLSEVKSKIFEAKPGNPILQLSSYLSKVNYDISHKGEALLILEGDAIIAQRNGVEPQDYRAEIYSQRRDRINSIVNKVAKEEAAKRSFGQTLSNLMISPLTGIPILAVILYAAYQVIGVFIAQTVVDTTEEIIMEGFYEPAVIGVVDKVMPLDSFLGSILAGDFGLLTMTVTYVIGLLMPLVIGFFFFLSLFEDSGYLPRIATLADRALIGLGLNGRGIIPLILGFGCVTMATITTRILASERERTIAIFLLGLTIPCSAQLGVIAGMLAGLGAQYLLLYTLVICSVLIMSGTALNALLPGSSSDLLIDLPPLRIPRPGNVLKKTGIKAYSFLREATPLFALGALIISIFEWTGILKILQNLLAPVTVGLLNLPIEASTAFIMGIIRRDFGAAGLNSMALTPIETTVALITITLFVPCIASIIVIFKERSKIEAAAIWAGSWVIAFTIGGVVAQLFSLLGSTNISFSLMVIFFTMIAFIFAGLSTLVKKRKEKRWAD